MPEKVGSGSNVTSPVTGSTMYEPCPGTNRDFCEQLFGSSIGLISHSVTLVANNGLAGLAGSFASGLIVCGVS